MTRKYKQECCDVGSNIVKNGTQKGTQRYKCKVCGKVFSEERSDKKYQRNTKRIISLLLNLLENDFFNEKDLEDALYKIMPEKYFKQIKFNTEYMIQKNKENLLINCFNPKLIICQDKKSITFIQIPRYEDNYKDISTSNMNEYKKRTIKIIDDVDQKGLIRTSNHIIPLIKE